MNGAMNIINDGSFVLIHGHSCDRQFVFNAPCPPSSLRWGFCVSTPFHLTRVIHGSFVGIHVN